MPSSIAMELKAQQQMYSGLSLGVVILSADPLVSLQPQSKPKAEEQRKVKSEHQTDSAATNAPTIPSNAQSTGVSVSFVNKAMASMLGYSHEEMEAILGEELQGFSRFYHLRNLPQAVTMFMEAVAQGSSSYCLKGQLVGRNGNLVPVAESVWIRYHSSGPAAGLPSLVTTLSQQLDQHTLSSALSSSSPPDMRINTNTGGPQLTTPRLPRRPQHAGAPSSLASLSDSLLSMEISPSSYPHFSPPSSPLSQQQFINPMMSMSKKRSRESPRNLSSLSHMRRHSVHALPSSARLPHQTPRRHSIASIDQNTLDSISNLGDQVPHFGSLPIDSVSLDSGSHLPPGSRFALSSPLGSPLRSPLPSLSFNESDTLSYFNPLASPTPSPLAKATNDTASWFGQLPSTEPHQVDHFFPFSPTSRIPLHMHETDVHQNMNARAP